MPRYLWLRIGIVLAVIVGSLVLIAPRDWRGHPRQPINLGLDLQGGIHLVLGVDLEKGIENVLDRMAGDLRQALQKKGIGAQVTRQGRAGVTIQLSSPQATQEAQQALASFVEFDTRSTDPAAGRIELTLKEKVITERRNSFVDQGLKVIRNRVDQFGVAEPTIQKQGDNRILVQLPGVQDPARAKALIGKTAVLEFKLVDDQVDAARRRPGRAAPGRRDPLRPARGPEHQGRDARALRRQEGDPADRRRHLGRHRPRVGRGGAVRLRPVRQRGSAPVRRGDREERGQGAGHRPRRQRPLGPRDPRAHPLRAGPDLRAASRSRRRATSPSCCAPARSRRPVQVLEERTVGPSLGADSIRKGVISTAAGALAVFVFMLIYYRLSGAIADLALLLNLAILLAAMAWFQATLTLPGIAGIVLTIGMAVDTNILIFERIREEFRLGKTVRSAIDAGFQRAFTTVIDTHVTVVVSGIILYQFGTGPVKGFAVTLMIGIVASLFTAVFFTRLIFDLVYKGRRRLQTLSI